MKILENLQTPIPRPRPRKRNLVWVVLVGLGASAFILLYKLIMFGEGV